MTQRYHRLRVAERFGMDPVAALALDHSLGALLDGYEHLRQAQEHRLIEEVVKAIGNGQEGSAELVLAGMGVQMRRR